VHSALALQSTTLSIDKSFPRRRNASIISKGKAESRPAPPAESRSSDEDCEGPGDDEEENEGMNDRRSSSVLLDHEDAPLVRETIRPATSHGPASTIDGEARESETLPSASPPAVAGRSYAARFALWRSRGRARASSSRARLLAERTLDPWHLVEVV